MILGRQLRNHHREGNYWLDTGGAIGIFSEYLFAGFFSDLYIKYEKWCRKNGVEKMNRKKINFVFLNESLKLNFTADY